MSFFNFKGNLRTRIFCGFLLICMLSILGSAMLSYFVLRTSAIEQSNTQMLNKSEALMSALDYAVSHSDVQTDDLPSVLRNKIYEIADVNKHDVVIYDMKGRYLLSNKDPNLIPQKEVPIAIFNKLMTSATRLDFRTFDKHTGGMMTSSYMILKNNMLEPIGIVYFPFYHNDSYYMEVYDKYMRYIVIVNIFIILISIFLSWLISKALTQSVTRFSELITQITLFEKELRPVKYYQNDEFSPLVKSYNKMILQIQDQKEKLAFIEKEAAWREMAKQVAHEVRNPLTPMKLTIQNFVRKFDPEDPDIREKVSSMSRSMVEQIDLIATVASAFSQFAQLPDKHDEVFSLNEEIKNIIGVFSDENIFIHANKDPIYIKIDKIYISRIITNLITNSVQAKAEGRPSIINVDLEQKSKRIIISIEDNGMGISPQQMEKIFEPNFTSKSGGTGLGLTMVRKMVEEYRGEISVQSEVGKGAKFIISLPDSIE